MTWLALGMFAKRVGSGILAWLSRRSLAEIAALLLALVALVEFVGLKVEQRHSAKLQGQLTAATKRLSTIADKSRQAEKIGKQISTEIKGRNDEENRHIAGDAGSLRVRGPGKALCRPAPAAPGKPESGPGPDATGPALPPADSAAVPWGWLTTRAEEHDQMRAEVLAWREWYQRLVAAWPKDTGAPAK